MYLELKRKELLVTQNFIGGVWQDAYQGEVFDIVNPATLDVIASVPASTEEDAKLAMQKAADAFTSWKTQTARTRSVILKKWNQLILDNKEDLGKLISTEQGKPLAEAIGEVVYASSYVEWFAEEALRINGDIMQPPVANRMTFALKEAVGVVAAITPWNFPAAMIARKLAPALAAGCTVVAKPAEDTPLTSLALVKLAEEAGIPAGVINIVTSPRTNTPAVVNVWLESPVIRKVTFTGSTLVGKTLAEKSAATLKKLSLELGGNAPFIVFEDADLDIAVESYMVAKFRNAGQTCVSPNRLYVHTSVHDVFLKKLSERVMALKVGPASEPDSQIGPMINQRAIDKIESHIKDALNKGARIICGGFRVKDDKCAGPLYFAPTILDSVNASMECSCEETFGPVVAVSQFEEEAEAIALANDSAYGLASYIQTQDNRRIWRMAKALETGIIGINEGGIADPIAPFGGIKESGYGREGSKYGLDDFMHIKYLCQGQLY
ncbi:NAD-dependent succinate-semialdehyde dehydrogenase [Pantoea cypripedii]|uniref:Succinate-semialdehyde dehydrogenase (NADP(+)) n=1 Tax=Pantoea cypripedii TaxID=55209 RepID=A0A6B9GHR8_PANCY|nr:NAD-dependent succinate-semialdehyde dehydrogenase [Pantoea cypripedii]QGY33305.1 succinate-semialdehyde dehydrogenase (NADP(+)) [Pantoea cypripedii]